MKIKFTVYLPENKIYSLPKGLYTGGRGEVRWCLNVVNCLTKQGHEVGLVGVDLNSYNDLPGLVILNPSKSFIDSVVLSFRPLNNEPKCKFRIINMWDIMYVDLPPIVFYKGYCR